MSTPASPAASPLPSAYLQTLQTALAGVRAPLPSSLKALVEEFGPHENPAAELFSAATLLSQAQRCARPLPNSPSALPAPAAEETLPPLASTRHIWLAQCLNLERPSLHQEIGHWLHQHSLRLPEWALPDYLNALKQLPQPIAANLLTGLGARGLWLAAQNSRWQPLLQSLPEVEERLWQEGLLAERMAWLKQLRQRDPTAATAALSRIWSQEPAEAREGFLACLADGLSMQDEALLEQARKDKRKEVRLLAITLLAELPQSRWTLAQLDRIKSWLQFTPSRLLGKAKLEVTLPGAWEKDWQWDGLSEKTTRTHLKIGDKANWLTEALSRLPLPTVLAALQVSAEDWFKAQKDHDYSTALRTASAESLARFPDLTGAETLLRFDQDHAVLVLSKLAVSRPVAAQTNSAWLTPWVKTVPLVVAGQLSKLPPLSEGQYLSISSAVLGELRSGKQGYWHLLPALQNLAESLPPSLLNGLLQELLTLEDQPQIGVEIEKRQLTPLIQLRQQLHRP